jgi:hypothetical protein
VMAFYGQLRKKQLRAESLSRRAWMMPHTHLRRFPPPTSQRFSTPF